MSFFEQLQDSTEAGRQYLFAAPLIPESLAGQTSTATYAAFLCQAFHHVSQTVPLLTVVGAALAPHHSWMRAAVAEYIEEETGHEEWVLNDIAACGYSREAARASTPNFATEVMISYAWDMISRINPLGFFGMVHVLEGTSIRLADQAADALQNSLSLPDEAFSYLRSHGALDQDHVKFFESLMNRVTSIDDQQCIVHACQNFYRLYGDVLRSVHAAQVSHMSVASREAVYAH